MADKAIVKTYQKDDLVIKWEPAKCIHSTKCWKGLLPVFNPKRRPWVDLEAASADRIAEQIDQCPSQALSYTRTGDHASAASDAAPVVKVQVMPNGPALVRGDVTVVNPDGSEEVKSGATALCRCGASARKPYCDGSHARIGFEG